ncbi:energy-coupling factor transporter ATPase [Heyndrickxia sporothermodurans]|uniref:Energy-coupling factor ABC transporter ATP-binding protein n=1 Tax=Heyndrickxia sporothermodurans TaxID=46224 RepID=A0AB37HDV8_9BACI|nr:energy-coupling factor ABC transporter ATP-binding protein [Heyndrickxia sporothermodurans]MBL5766501.1 energy-coupling factor ABC transporter ATP-binding protein [Heyndrickxia sporothermodurans]MBL5769988.1 energy-coupling factor ABC transporter ATP-binding protein [Heyndrickxia sporothermodurans]MBL5773665.1 energy-coupling factor ABC transporter ATP-binding protein [Heyndrickxia sporothermodurans]MBL5777266.1 energy-coupling factor ABC transporter ATP-binding protein [Heyndrickxia sporoth
MPEEIISIEHVYFRYPGQDPYVLNDISLSVQKGEWLAIVGHNGSGKSTLAKMLNGLHYPEKGNVTVDQLPLSEETVWEIRKRIGMVFQNPDNQFVGTTVQDDVAFGLENSGVPQEIMAERVKDALERVNMLSFLDQEPHHLSGGQKQRVAIAGIIAIMPKVIILDEATSMLDPKGRQEVLETIRELKDKLGLTVISITHDLEEASRADRMIVLNKGEVFKKGKPIEIFQLEDELVELGLDIPFTIKMTKKLTQLGFNFPNTYITEEELVDALWTLHLNK